LLVNATDEVFDKDIQINWILPLQMLNVFKEASGCLGNRVLAGQTMRMWQEGMVLAQQRRQIDGTDLSGCFRGASLRKMLEQHKKHAVSDHRSLWLCECSVANRCSLIEKRVG